MNETIEELKTKEEIRSKNLEMIESITRIADEGK